VRLAFEQAGLSAESGITMRSFREIMQLYASSSPLLVIPSLLTESHMLAAYASAYAIFFPIPPLSTQYIMTPTNIRL